MIKIYEFTYTVQAKDEDEAVEVFEQELPHTEAGLFDIKERNEFCRNCGKVHKNETAICE